jgi:hypothetical protein
MKVSSKVHAPAALPPGETARGIHYIGGWVGPTADLGVIEKRKSLASHRELNPDSSVVQPIA